MMHLLDCRVSVTLPHFPGFYESMLSGAIDSYEEMEVEHEAGPDSYGRNSGPPEETRLTAAELYDLRFKCTDYQKTYINVARFWVEEFDGYMHEHAGTPLGSFQFELMSSPREYNFTTDRVFALVPFSVIASLMKWSEANNHESLDEVIRSSFTSYDGFISFYSNDIECWLDKPLRDWDYNELGSLVGARLVALDEFRDRSSFLFDMYERVFSGNGEEDQAIAIDYRRYQFLIAEKREEKRLALLEAEEAV